MRIVVVGAYGYTGRLICEVLSARGHTYAIAGRDVARLNDLAAEFTMAAVHRVDISHPEQCDTLVDRFDLIINCVGPYSEYSEGLLASCTGGNKLYLDVCGESDFVGKSYEDWRDTGACVVHSCSFESALSDLATSMLTKEHQVLEMRSFYKFSRARPSPGTRLTMKLGRFKVSRVLSQGKFSEVDPREVLRLNARESAVHFMLPEIGFALWAHDIPTAASYLALPRDQAVMAHAGHADHAADRDGVARVLSRHARSNYTGPAKEERALQDFELKVETRSVDGLRCLTLKGKDMYAVTAELIGEAVTVLTTQAMRGWLTPSSLFKGREAEVLQRLNISVELDD